MTSERIGRDVVAALFARSKKRHQRLLSHMNFFTSSVTYISREFGAKVTNPSIVKTGVVSVQYK